MESGVALAAVLGGTVLDLLCAQLTSQKSLAGPETYDYGDRSGFPRSASAMRGAAGGEVPRDMRTREALRPFDQA
jgi:hypothetical protein